MDTVAQMPCNPAIGGTAKGHLVREIDALGGLMGRASMRPAIQFKLLNRSRGPAVWSPRAQADKRRYGAVGPRMRSSAKPNITWIFGRAGRILVEDGRVAGLAIEDGDIVTVRRAGCDDRHVPQRLDSRRATSSGPPGRAGEPPTHELAESLHAVRLRHGPV